MKHIIFLEAVVPAPLVDLYPVSLCSNNFEQIINNLSLFVEDFYNCVDDVVNYEDKEYPNVLYYGVLDYMFNNRNIIDANYGGKTFRMCSQEERKEIVNHAINWLSTLVKMITPPTEKELEILCSKTKNGKSWCYLEGNTWCD